MPLGPTNIEVAQKREMGMLTVIGSWTLVAFQRPAAHGLLEAVKTQQQQLLYLLSKHHLKSHQSRSPLSAMGKDEHSCDYSVLDTSATEYEMYFDESQDSQEGLSRRPIFPPEVRSKGLRRVQITPYLLICISVGVLCLISTMVFYSYSLTATITPPALTVSVTTTVSATNTVSTTITTTTTATLAPVQTVIPVGSVVPVAAVKQQQVDLAEINTSTKKPSLVKKVTGLYGRGTWSTPNSESESEAYLSRAMAIHDNQARLHNHQQHVSTTQLFGNVLEDAYSKIGNLMQQNLVEMSKSVESRAKWLL
jgi:hypothetical protein